MADIYIYIYTILYNFSIEFDREICSYQVSHIPTITTKQLRARCLHWAIYTGSWLLLIGLWLLVTVGIPDYRENKQCGEWFQTLVNERLQNFYEWMCYASPTQTVRHPNKPCIVEERADNPCAFVAIPYVKGLNKYLCTAICRGLGVERPHESICWKFCSLVGLCGIWMSPVVGFWGKMMHKSMDLVPLRNRF